MSFIRFRQQLINIRYIQRIYTTNDLHKYYVRVVTTDGPQVEAFKTQEEADELFKYIENRLTRRPPPT